MSRSPWWEEGPMRLLGDPPTHRRIHQHPWGVLCPASSLLGETGTGGTHRLWSDLPVSGRGKPRCVCHEDDTLLASLLPTLPFHPQCGKCILHPQKSLALNSVGLRTSPNLRLKRTSIPILLRAIQNEIKKEIITYEMH